MTSQGLDERIKERKRSSGFQRIFTVAFDFIYQVILGES